MYATVQGIPQRGCSSSPGEIHGVLWSNASQRLHTLYRLAKRGALPLGLGAAPEHAPQHLGVAGQLLPALLGHPLAQVVAGVDGVAVPGHAMLWLGREAFACTK